MATNYTDSTTNSNNNKPSLDLMDYSLCLDNLESKDLKASLITLRTHNLNSSEYHQLTTPHQHNKIDASFYYAEDDETEQESNKKVNTVNNKPIELDTVKHKLSSIWNNFKYGNFFLLCNRHNNVNAAQTNVY